MCAYLTHDLAELISIALTNYPALKAQRRRIDREQYNVQLAKKDFYPDFSVGLTYINRPGLPEMYGVNVGVKLPLYFWQKQRPAVAEATASAAAEKQQLIGVEYGTVYKTVSKTLRVVGRLTFDETKIVRIHPRVEGWIEQVSLDFIGKLVQKGQPLISIYSPELMQTQQEFLLARRGRDELSQSPFREAVSSSESLYQAARKRLELWDITEKQINELEKSGKPSKAVTIYAPTAGFVLTRNAFTKQRVTPDTELYTIADFSTIWVIADIYEYEAPELKLGRTQPSHSPTFLARHPTGT